MSLSAAGLRASMELSLPRVALRRPLRGALASPKLVQVRAAPPCMQPEQAGWGEKEGAAVQRAGALASDRLLDYLSPLLQRRVTKLLAWRQSGPGAAGAGRAGVEVRPAAAASASPVSGCCARLQASALCASSLPAPCICTRKLANVCLIADKLCDSALGEAAR
jgi:hypothetical protein